MLPKELLDVRRARGKIYPKFADPENPEDVELAEKVIAIFRSGRGKKYGSVVKAIKKLEKADNFRKVRGFVRVLENLCVEKACAYDSELEPKKVRMFLFERGFVTTKSERDRILAYAAKYFNVSVDEIERAMYADRDEELIVTRVEGMNAVELIKLYNLSLLQTSIFNSTTMKLEVSGNYKGILRAVKWLGLMYDIVKAGKSLEIEVLGPASLIKMTRKYGILMAKLIPHVLVCDRWRILAKIVEGDRIYTLDLDSGISHLLPDSSHLSSVHSSSTHSSLPSPHVQTQSQAHSTQITRSIQIKQSRQDWQEEFDSSYETELFRRLRNLGYSVEREPEVVAVTTRVGEFAFVPDFAVSREGWSGKVYLELVGFWTADYLKKKAEKVSSLSIPLVVVAREEFGDVRVRSGRTGFGLVELVIFSKRFDYGKIVRAINRLAERVGVIGERKRVVGGVDVDEVGGEEGEKEEEEEQERREAIEKARREIQEVKPESVGELEKILEKYGLEINEELLKDMGVKIVWRGLEGRVLFL